MTNKDVVSILSENDNYLILTHTRPDGDTLCSAAALCSALRRVGKKAFVFENPEITENFIEFIAPFYLSEKMDSPFVISVDTATEKMLSLGFEGEVKLCIDHHESNSHYAENTLVQSGKSSTGEIIMELIEMLCGNISKDEANLIYIALSTYTGCFCY